jgi:hypothetical protein
VKSEPLLVAKFLTPLFFCERKACFARNQLLFEGVVCVTLK